jgi:hypothetical protein
VSLPASSAASRTETVELSGGPVTVHGLTLNQSRACRDATENEADALCISWGTDTPAQEVRDWLMVADPADAKKLLNAIMGLSGLTEAAKFPE